eukprot:scaffold99608_cov19-Tisochrysis_lutea.AAC.2
MLTLHQASSKSYSTAPTVPGFILEPLWLQPGGVCGLADQAHLMWALAIGRRRWKGHFSLQQHARGSAFLQPLLTGEAFSLLHDKCEVQSNTLQHASEHRIHRDEARASG